VKDEISGHLKRQPGLNFIVDDTPETIIISGFDPVRREVARLSLQRLVADGRIHRHVLKKLL